MALGIIGIERFQARPREQLPGQTISLDQYTLTFRDLTVFDTADGRNVARAVVGVKKADEILVKSIRGVIITMNHNSR